MTKPHPIVKNALAALKSAKSLVGWSLSHFNVEKYQLYLTKQGEIEASIESVRDDVDVTIYTKEKDSLGESSFSLTTSNKSEIASAIRDAKLLASHVKQDPFELAKPDPRENPNVALADEELLKARKDGTVDVLLRQTALSIVGEFKKYKGVRLSSMELHASFAQNSLRTSKRINLSGVTTKVYWELVITAGKGRKEQEYTPELTVRRLADLDIKENVKSFVTIARDVQRSTRPKPYRGPVAITGQALADFFAPHLSANPLVTHASARLAHMGLSRYKKNEDVSTGYIEGDRITILSNPLCNYNIGSRLYDGDGIPSRKLALVKDGRFKNYIASKKYADYLKISPSGPLGVIQVLPGSKGQKELLKGLRGAKGVYEIISFASFVPNDISGDFAAEIRLGYYHKGKTSIPLKGGMISGNIFELATNWFLSKETMEMPGYIGPTVLYLPQGSIF